MGNCEFGNAYLFVSLIVAGWVGLSCSPKEDPDMSESINSSHLQTKSLSGQVGKTLSNTHVLPDGATYEGPLVNGKPEGTGVIRYRYVADYPRDFDPLLGIISTNASDIKHGLKVGQQCVYRGTVKNGLPHGTGTKECSDHLYKGQWQNGVPHGQGTFSIERSGYQYLGGWENGKRQGPGELRFLWLLRAGQLDGVEIVGDISQLDDELISVVFQGEFRDDKLEGAGACIVNKLKPVSCVFHNGILTSTLKIGKKLWIRISAASSNR